MGKAACPGPQPGSPKCSRVEKNHPREPGKTGRARGMYRLLSNPYRLCNIHHIFFFL
jgi:hypothetical protein